MDPQPPKELCLLIPGHKPRGGMMPRQKLCSHFLPNTRLSKRATFLNHADFREIIPEYRPLIAFAYIHKDEFFGDLGQSYNNGIFNHAARMSGPFLRYPGTLFLFHDPFEAMVDYDAPDKFRAMSFPILDRIHRFSRQFQISPSQIIYMVIEGGDTNKIPYNLYYEEHPELEPVKFIYYPSLEAKTSLHFHQAPEPLSSEDRRSRKFTYLNRWARYQRVDLCANLWDRGILDTDWYWSFLDNPHPWYEKRHPEFCKMVPKVLDIEPFQEDGSPVQLHPSSHADAHQFFNDSYISLVSETTTGNKKELMDAGRTHVFLTEKTFKCFYFQHPFIIWGYSHTLREIRKLGYQTFSPWINEDYDEIEDYDKRMEAIIEEVLRLKKLTLSQLQKMRQEMQHILDYNFEHFKLYNIQARNLCHFQREINKKG